MAKTTFVLVSGVKEKKPKPIKDNTPTSYKVLDAFDKFRAAQRRLAKLQDKIKKQRALAKKLSQEVKKLEAFHATENARFKAYWAEREKS